MVTFGEGNSTGHVTAKIPFFGKISSDKIFHVTRFAKELSTVNRSLLKRTIQWHQESAQGVLTSNEYHE